jgi:hypothetical protein
MSNTLDILETAKKFARLPSKLRREIEVVATDELDTFADVVQAIQQGHLRKESIPAIITFLTDLEEACPIDENKDAIEALTAYVEHTQCRDSKSVWNLLLRKSISTKGALLVRKIRGKPHTYQARFGNGNPPESAEMLDLLAFDMGIEISTDDPDEGMTPDSLPRAMRSGAVTLHFPHVD